MEKLMKFTAVLFVFTVVLCIFCYNSEDYVAKTHTTTTVSTTEESHTDAENVDVETDKETEGQKAEIENQ